MLPGTGSPEVCTVTCVSVPPKDVTVMPADGSAWVAPFAGVILTWGPAAVPPLAWVLALAAGLTWLVPCPPPVHAVVSRATSASTAIFCTTLTSAPVPPKGMAYTRDTTGQFMCIPLTLNQIDVTITYMNTRRYSMATRGRQAEATRQRILAAARDLFAAKSSGFTLESVAGAAGVSVQTVLRAFGSKEALIIAAVGTFRGGRSRPVERAASPEQTVRRLFDDYEEIGHRVVWILAEEHQVTGFAEAARLGRANHRGWVEQSFEAQLRQHPAGEKEAVV